MASPLGTGIRAWAPIVLLTAGVVIGGTEARMTIIENSTRLDKLEAKTWSKKAMMKFAADRAVLKYKVSILMGRVGQCRVSP